MNWIFVKMELQRLLMCCMVWQCELEVFEIDLKELYKSFFDILQYMKGSSILMKEQKLKL